MFSFSIFIPEQFSFFSDNRLTFCVSSLSLTLLMTMKTSRNIVNGVHRTNLHLLSEKLSSGEFIIPGEYGAIVWTSPHLFIIKLSTKTVLRTHALASIFGKRKKRLIQSMFFIECYYFCQTFYMQTILDEIITLCR